MSSLLDINTKAHASFVSSLLDISTKAHGSFAVKSLHIGKHRKYITLITYKEKIKEKHTISEDWQIEN